MGCRQCLPLIVVQLKGKHCPKPHCCNGVVDTLGKSVISRSGYQALDRQSSELRRLVERYKKAFLFCCFPKCWFFVQWRTSRRNETCADQTRRDAPWARVVNFVKKPSLIINVTYLVLNGFNASMWGLLKYQIPKSHNALIDLFKFHQICVIKHKYKNHIKFEVSLHFWPIWPTVGHLAFTNGIKSL